MPPGTRRSPPTTRWRRRRSKLSRRRTDDCDGRACPRPCFEGPFGWSRRPAECAIAHGARTHTPRRSCFLPWRQFLEQLMTVVMDDAVARSRYSPLPLQPARCYAALPSPWPEACRCPPPSPPLAPPDVPEMPVIAGVRLATAAAGIRYKGRTDVLLALLDKGTTGCRRVHQVEMPVGAGRMVSRQAEGGQCARAGGQLRQRQRLHRQDRQGVHRADRADRSEGGRLLDLGSVPRLDRRDRRAARRHQVRRRAGAARRDRDARPLDGRRQCDHDHRYLPEGRDRDREARQGQGDDQRHGQGRRHDHARHGDHAVLHLHRRARYRPACCNRCSRPASRTPSTR